MYKYRLLDTEKDGEKRGRESLRGRHFSQKSKGSPEKGPYVYVAVCSERDALGPIADVLTAKALRGNSILIARDFAGTDGTLA